MIKYIESLLNPQETNQQNNYNTMAESSTTKPTKAPKAPRAPKGTKKTKAVKEETPVETTEPVAASTSPVKKEVDLDFVIPIAHIKKYISKYRMNKDVNDQIDITKACSEHEKKPELVDNLTQETLKMIEEYYQNMPEKNKKNLPEMDQYQRALHALSIFKHKFSGNAFVVVTYVLNLAAREIITHSLEQTLSDKKKSLTSARIPWSTLKSQMLSGLYMNTSKVHTILNAASAVVEEEPVVETEETTAETEEPTPEVEADAEEETEEEEDASSVEAKLKKYNLKHFLHKMAKSIIVSDERFTGFKINSSFTEECNSILIEVMERFIRIVHNLLDISTNKTINDKTFLAATKIMLDDNIYAVSFDKSTLYSLIEAKLASAKTSKQKKE